MYVTCFIKFSVKLNGGRNIVGILRGFDPFMNLVIDETVEETKDGSRNTIGMVVSKLIFPFHIIFRPLNLFSSYFLIILLQFSNK